MSSQADKAGLTIKSSSSSTTTTTTTTLGISKRAAYPNSTPLLMAPMLISGLLVLHKNWMSLAF